MFSHLKSKNREVSYDKAPATYDDYICTLSPKFREIAERELGETEEIRTKSLKELREWIANNPNIISCRTDAIFLLRFLRVCKFRVPHACRKLENYLKIREKNPKWFENVSYDDPSIKHFFDAGYMTALPEKDKNGRQILFFQTTNFDPKKIKAVDCVRLGEFFSQMFAEDEEVQVAGLMLVFDDTSFNVGHVTMWGLKELRESVKFVSNAMPVRFCGMHRVHFPSVGRAIFELIKSMLPSKIQQRIRMFKCMEDAHKEGIINIDLLPKEYNPNAKYGYREMIDEFIEAAITRNAEIQQDNISIKYKKIDNKEIEVKQFNDINANFRELTVD